MIYINRHPGIILIKIINMNLNFNTMISLFECVCVLKKLRRILKFWFKFMINLIKKFDFYLFTSLLMQYINDKYFSDLQKWVVQMKLDGKSYYSFGSYHGLNYDSIKTFLKRCHSFLFFRF